MGRGAPKVTDDVTETLYACQDSKGKKVSMSQQNVQN